MAEHCDSTATMTGELRGEPDRTNDTAVSAAPRRAGTLALCAVLLLPSGAGLATTYQRAVFDVTVGLRDLVTGHDTNIVPFTTKIALSVDPARDHTTVYDHLTESFFATQSRQGPAGFGLISEEAQTRGDLRRLRMLEAVDAAGRA